MAIHANQLKGSRSRGSEVRRRSNTLEDLRNGKEGLRVLDTECVGARCGRVYASRLERSSKEFYVVLLVTSDLSETVW